MSSITGQPRQIPQWAWRAPVKFGSMRTKRDGEATFKGYLLSDFTEAFATYLPDQTVTPSQPNNDGHCDALQNVTLENDVTVSKASQANNDGHCDSVTVSTASFARKAYGLTCEYGSRSHDRTDFA